MRAPAFWWAPDPSPAALALAPLGWIYGALTAARMGRVGAPVACPVICVGNLVAGGAGKTPTALALARLLRDMGRRPVFLSRGYGGTLRGPVLVDPSRHGAAECGDEPLLLAAVAPTVVSADRVAGAGVAAALGDVVVMDDGLQNPSLAKDLRLAVVDGATGVGNGLCLPAGPLRAPLGRQWPHVDAVIVIGPGAAGTRVAEVAARRGKPVLRGALAPDAAATSRLQGQAVLAFAGIGRPAKFFETLDAAGAQVRIMRPFPDHHAYGAEDIRPMLAEARRQGLACWTTEKDAVRLAGILAPEERAAIQVLPVSLVLEHPADVTAMLGRLSGGDRP